MSLHIGGKHPDEIESSSIGLQPSALPLSYGGLGGIELGSPTVQTACVPSERRTQYEFQGFIYILPLYMESI